MEELTRRQGEILALIQEYIYDEGYPPTRMEIAEAFGFRSPNAAEEHLRALERKGYIELLQGSSRGIRLLGSEEQEEGLPVVGRVAAGQPLWAEQNIEGNFYIDRSFVPGEHIFALKVAGDSMRDAGILDGDYVLVRRQQTAQKGEIVVAQIDDEATVKRFYLEKKRIRLEPENPDFGPIIVEKGTPGFMIAGKVIGLMRKM